LLGTALLIFAVYKNFSNGKNKKTETAIVKQGKLEEKLTISGTIDAEEKTTLRFQTSGRLTWVGVKEGDYVKKYQGIAALDQREVKKKLEKELNDYLTSRWTFEQKKRDDYRDQVMTDTVKRVLEKAQFDLNNTVLDVEIQNLSVEFANLWTPIEGIVTKVAAPYAGVNITAATSEFEVVNPNTVYFAALADQTEVTKLSGGELGELTLDAYPDATLSGSIKNISFIPKSGETGTVYAVKFIFPGDNSSYKYRIGMAGDLSFVTKRKENVLYTSSKFIKSQNGKKYVTVKRNGKEEKVFVETGMETDNSVEIISGVSAGEVISD
ncbi:efflux RND transporter periplasmic adaptor subunit, partial [Candidatus Gottesmanbacteria bacterium]|nr:efflux RND transporter periplasmic adaptor subunit [Candidatus Gottesmanbacteria bacterium]